WLTIASSLYWWGGHCYGPRMFSDMVPFLTYLLAPAAENIGWSGPPKRRWLTASFAALALLSFLIHLPGATSWRAYQWNSEPVEVGTQTARLWSWVDLQPLRALRHH